MSFNCPHLTNENICTLMDVNCAPMKGKCILRGRYANPAMLKKLKEKEEKELKSGRKDKN